MYLGEVSILTDDVPRLAAFYKALLGVDNGSDDPAIRRSSPERPC